VRMVQCFDHSLPELLELALVVEWCTWVSGQTPFADEHVVTSPRLDLVSDPVNRTVHYLILVLALVAPDHVLVPFVPEVRVVRGWGELSVVLWVLLP